MTKAYTEEEVQQLLRDREDKLEAKHFEEKTEEVLKDINRRLNESNGYKNTIGKDVKDVKEELTILKPLIIGHIADPIHSEAKKRFEDQDRIAALFSESDQSEIIKMWQKDLADYKTKALKSRWWKDWLVRIGIVGTLIWEVLNLYQANGGSIHGLVHFAIGK